MSNSPIDEHEWRNEVEKRLLGTMLIDPPSIETAVNLLEEKNFVSPAHRIIFRAIMTLRACKRVVTHMTVREHIRKSRKLRLVGGPHGIDELIQYSYGSDTPFAYLAKRLMERR